ncbi:SDR family NAD(P)-dependent oxidoreductase [Acinetobacter sp. XH1639]|uniref:SDR family NAD(P)-dependent oxidoreductase n=1 Tax=Acinetobacter sp. XH1639 TaxID=3157368 RepID=UPI0032B503CA
MKKYDLKNKVVVITGSTGGLGSAAAKALHHKGAKLALLDLDIDKVKTQAKALGKDEVAIGLYANVCSLETLETAMADVIKHFGKIDIVIANAGIGVPNSLEHISPREFERTIDINLTGVFRTFRSALPYVKKTQGYLLAISSMAAFVHSPLNTHYTSSKAGVWALSDSLRLELKHLNVGVGSFHPTFFQTPMMDAVQKNPAGKAIWKGNTGMWKYVPIETVIAELLMGIEKREELIIVPRKHSLIAKAPALFRQVIEFIGFDNKRLKHAIKLAENSNDKLGN